jgi:hypothetical protein
LKTGVNYYNPFESMSMQSFERQPFGAASREMSHTVTLLKGFSIAKIE